MLIILSCLIMHILWSTTVDREGIEMDDFIMEFREMFRIKRGIWSPLWTTRW